MDDVNKKLDSIEEKLEEHTKILSNVDKTLALQAQQLELHIKRTELAEENLALLRKDFKPVEQQSELIAALAKGLSLLGGLTAAIYYALKILGKI